MVLTCDYENTPDNYRDIKNGTNRHYIQSLLGHSSSKATDRKIATKLDLNTHQYEMI